MTNLSVPFLILIAIWGGFSVVLKAIEMLNNQRNIILDIKIEGRALSKKQKNIILEHDYEPLSLGTCIFLFCFSLIVITAPVINKGWNYTDFKPSEIICYLGIDIFIVFATGVMIRSFWEERKMMKSHLQDNDKNQ